MNKIFFILLLSFITYVYLDGPARCSETANPKSADDCKDKLTDYDKDNGNAYCCYFSYSKKSENNRCTGLSKKEYDNIGKYMKIQKKYLEMGKIQNEIDPDDDYEDVGKIKVDCNSNYIKLGILILLLFLI